MNQPLYTIEILRLAASLPEFTPLPEPRGVGERRSQTCGSHVWTEVKLDTDDRVAEIAQKVQACAFGQASASVVASCAIGSSPEEIVRARESFAAWLGDEAELAADWPGLRILAPARPKTARHPAMLLPFDALIAAIDDARKPSRP